MQNNQKVIELVQKKLQNDQIILSIQKITFLTKNSKKLEDVLIVTNFNLIFVQNQTIKKIITLKQFKYLTIAILANQLIFHCEKQWIRIQSESNVKIVGNILMAKQKFLNDKSPLMVHLEMEKSLQNIFSQSSTSKSIWKIFSHKKQSQIGRKSESRESFTTIQVSQKNFILQIGKKMYETLFKNTILLYNNGALGFRFDWQTYQSQQPSIYQTFYWKAAKKQARIVKRKIPKSTFRQDQQIRRMLKSFKLSEYSQEIYFCIQAQTHFQVISPYFSNCTTCSQWIQQERILSESILKKIFYQLYHFICDDSQVLLSLSSSHIHFVQNQVKISTIFCKIARNINVNTLSPQQLQHITENNEEFSQNQIFKINLWKIGVILFELSYLKYPFVIQYLASKVKRNQPLKLHFPDYDERSIQYQHFIKSLLCKDPMIRANKLKGEVRSSIINPSLTTILNHEWLANKIQK